MKKRVMAIQNRLSANDKRERVEKWVRMTGLTGIIEKRISNGMARRRWEMDKGGWGTRGEERVINR